MSQDGPELVRRFVDALNRRDLKDFLAVCHPDVQLRSLASDLGGTFRGHAGIRSYFREFTDTFDDYHFEIERIEDRGDLMVRWLRVHARAGASGVDLDWRAVVAFRLRDGRLWRVAACRSEEEALDSVGVRNKRAN